MKRLRRIALLLVVLALALAVTACGSEDEEIESGSSRDKKNGGKDSKQTEVLKIPATEDLDTPEKLVKCLLESQEFVSEWAEQVEAEVFLFSSPTALKALDLYEEEDDDVNTKWEISGSKEYTGDDAVTDGVKAYVRKKGGDTRSIQGAALVEVTVSVSYQGDIDEIKQYYTTVLVNGKWYLGSDNSKIAKNFEAAETYWTEQAQ